MKKNKIYLINIILTVSIFMGIIILNRISPFGGKLLSRSDAITMFKPMLYNFITRLRTGTLINYTFNNGLGAATIFDFIYDLASPLNLIALLFKTPDAMYLSTTLLKIVIASITMTFYANKKTNNKVAVVIATLSYVFSSWFIAYNFYLPWLDIFLIFPLFQYSLEKIIDEHKYHLYIFCLAYMIITNLYLCFSVCVYTIIYFVVYKIFYKKDSFKNKLLSFDYISLATIGAFFLSFFYLYAWYDSLLKIKIGFEEFSTSPYTVSFIDFIKSFYYSNISFVIEMSGKTFPNIACPTIILVSFIYYLLNKDENTKDKIFVIISSLICLAIIFIPRLDYIMNAFHQIRGLTYRYSFIISFLMIRLFIKNGNNKNWNKRNVIISFIIILIGILSLYKFINLEMFIINLVFILSFFVLAIFYNKNKIYKYLVVLFFIIQVFYTTNLYFQTSSPKEIPDINTKITNDINYRINNENTKILYDDQEAINTYLNNKTTFIYSSLTYSNIIYLYNALGNETFSNTYAIMYDTNTIPSLLFNVKSKNNDYYLEKIYAANVEIAKTIIDDTNTKNTIEYIIKDMTGIEEIYNKEILLPEIENNKNVYKINHDYALLEIVDKKNNISISPIFNNTFIKNNIDDVKSVSIYTIKEEKLKEIYDYLSKNQIKYASYQDNHLKGTINVDKDQLIFTSIPYDKDWKVKVDGQVVKATKILDSLMAIEVEPGEHEIELEYKTHFLIPALISISTLVILITDYIIKIKKQKNIS